MTAGHAELAPLRDGHCLGLSAITLVARQPFWDEADLPFTLHGAGILRVEPQPAFAKHLLAGSADELAVMPDCPDAPGWLVPEGIVARWMALQVRNATLDDILLSHPLYTHLVQPDAKERSRGGRARLVHWTPGIPTQAHLTGPEFLPGNPQAPIVNRQRAKYAAACEDLVARLDKAFPLAEIELAFAFQR